MGKTRAKLIYNPYAGNAADPTGRLDDALRCLKRHGLKVDVAVASPAEQATKAARQAARAGYRLVIAMGGDGTIMASAVLQQPPQPLCIPADREQRVLRDWRSVQGLGQGQVDAAGAAPLPAVGPGVFFRPEEDAAPSKNVRDARLPQMAEIHERREHEGICVWRQYAGSHVIGHF